MSLQLIEDDYMSLQLIEDDYMSLQLIEDDYMSLQLIICRYWLISTIKSIEYSFSFENEKFEIDS
jgi:hypothetical protein